MIQTEEKIRRYLRKVDGMIEGMSAMGLSIPFQLAIERYMLRWVLGQHPDPSEMSEDDLLKMEEEVAKVRSKRR